MVAKDGRFGMYVTDGEYNATLRKDDSLETLTPERAFELLAEYADHSVFHATLVPQLWQLTQTLHGGGEMREGGARRSLNLRFFSEGARYLEREAGHSPEYPGVAEIHKHGDVLQHAWFPQVYPRQNVSRSSLPSTSRSLPSPVALGRHRIALFLRAEAIGIGGSVGFLAATEMGRQAANRRMGKQFRDGELPFQ